MKLARNERLLFAEDELIPWKSEWQGMPEYNHEHLMPKFQIVVSFACEADLLSFSELIEQNIPATAQKERKSIWFPPADIGRHANKRYIQQ